MGLRIAVLSRNFASTGGGAERYSMALVEQWAAQHEVHVFAQNIEQVLDAVHYHVVPTPLRRPRWMNQLYFAWATWRATRTGFDLVHSHENTWHGQLQTVHVLPIKYTLFAGKTGLAKALRWLKVITSVRLLAYLWLEHARYRHNRARRVVVTSHTLERVMLQTYPKAAGMLHVIPPGVAQTPGLAVASERSTARAALGLPQGVRYILFVGNDVRKKGLPTLLQALHSLPLELHLLVVGSLQQRDQMEKIASAHGVMQRVHFLGTLQDMGNAYRAANLLVHPTLEDTYAMVVLEAMAHGLPVVVSAAPYCGIAQELSHGDNALLLNDPRSPAEVAVAIMRCVQDEALANRLSAQALQFARQHTWAQTAQAYNALLTPFMAPKRARWLVLSHAFNMDGRAASQTITDKLPHLQAAGIELLVLSGVSGRKDTHYAHYQLWPVGPAGIRFELRHVLRRRWGSGLRYRLCMVLASLLLLPGMVLEKLLWPVESSWSWCLSAYCKARWLARRQKFDLIYSTGGAFAAHIAAKHLRDAWHVPWMAEVHDPLVTPGQAPHIRLSAQQRKQQAVESMICSHADLALWFTEAALRSAQLRHPQLADKGRMLLPGIDAPAHALPPYVPGVKFVMGHFGSLSATRNLLPVLGALESLVQKNREWENVLELHVYGGPLDRISGHALERSAVRNCVHHFGRIEQDASTGLSGREQILRRMRAVDVLLLLHGEDAMCAQYIPSKLYEYLWMQRPIVALVHNNAQMLGLLRSQGHVAIATQGLTAPQVVLALQQALEQLLQRWRTAGLADNGLVSPYTTALAVEKMVQWAKNLTVDERRN